MARNCVASRLLVLAALTLVPQGVWAQGANGNPGVIPPNAQYRGMTYGEWGARFWQTAFAMPVVGGIHPLVTGGAFQGDKGVLFLTGVGGPTTFDLTVPAGTPLFFPVINAECSVLEPPPFHGDNEAELRATANGIIDHTSGRFAVIDGRPVNNLDAYRCQSPLFTFGPLPPDNIFDYWGMPDTVGVSSDSVDAGVYLLLAPLSVGQHTIHFGGTFDDFSYTIDTTYNITVVPSGP